MSSIIYDDAPLEERIHRSLSDTFKHRAIETAQDVITGKRNALVAEVDNWEEFRDHAAQIRDHVLANLDYYVREFATNAQKTVLRCISRPPILMHLSVSWIFLKILVPPRA